MQKSPKQKKPILTLLMLLLITTVLCGTAAVITPAQSSSAVNSQPSATPVPDEAFRRAVAEALEELRAARKVIDAQKSELKIAYELIALERQVSDGLKNIRTLDAAERQQLQQALAAKDRVIAAYEAEIVVLKKNRWSGWKWLKAAAVGAGAGIVIGAIAGNR